MAHRQESASGMTWTCWVDRRTCIVVRNKRAVSLGLVQFAIFEALHRQSRQPGEPKKLTGDSLADIVYNGASNPSTRNTIHSTVQAINPKIQHLGLKIRGVNRKQNSFYEIVELT